MRLSGLCLALLAGAALAGAAPAASPDIAGVWWTKSYTPRLLPMDGTPLPFTPEGRTRYAATMAGLKSGKIVDPANHVCLPQGMPRALTSAWPLGIMATPSLLLVAHEENRVWRTIRMSDEHANTDDWDPSFMGEGIGKWDGTTLVIDTTNFKAESIYLDGSGVPVSDQLHLVERVRTLDDGKTLEVLLTIEDPVIFTKPWTARLLFDRRIDIQLQTDWVCGQPHRDVFSLTGKVAR